MTRWPSEWSSQLLNHHRMRAAYWRCLVLWDCNGLSWERGPQLSGSPKLRLARRDDVKQVHITGATWSAVAAQSGYTRASYR